jgi:galactokinase
VPETIHLAQRARELGAHAASAFGAGFGGSVWAMVDRDDADLFGQRWLEGFEQRFPAAARYAQCFTARPAAGARRIN